MVERAASNQNSLHEAGERWTPPEGLAPAIATALAVVEKEFEPLERVAAEPDTRAYFGGGRFVRDDDLRVLDTLGAAATAAAGAGFFMNLSASAETAVISAATGIVVAVAKLLRAAYRKGAVVDPLQCLILLALRGSMSGMNVAELTRTLNAGGSAGRHEWTEAEVSSVLDDLRNVRLGDGTIVPLVQVDPFQRWSAAGV